MQKETLYAVFGLGTFGQEVCKALSEKGSKVIAVDKDQKLIDKMKDIVTQAVLLDSTDEDVLKNVGLQDVDVAVVAMGDSVDGSILTTVLLKNIGVPYIIARAISDVHAQVLQKVGATEILNIAVQQGRRLAQKILATDIVDIIPISDDHSIAEIKIPSGFVEKSLRDTELRKKYHLTLVSIKRIETTIDEMGNPRKEELILYPTPDDILKINDSLVVLGSDKDIENLKEL